MGLSLCFLNCKLRKAEDREGTLRSPEEGGRARASPGLGPMSSSSTFPVQKT